MAQLRSEVLEKAMKCTGIFEGGYPTGNFDGMGLSMGILQWNLGSGTLQPILNEVFSNYIAETWQLQELKLALESNNVLQFAKSIMNAGGTKLVEPWRSRLNNLNFSEEFISIASKYCGTYQNIAVNLCERYGLTTDRAYCLAFDIAVQKGGLKSYTMIETEYMDKLKSWVEVAVATTTGKINGSVELCKKDVRARKEAYLYATDMGRGWPSGVTFDDESMYVQEKTPVNSISEAIPILVTYSVITGPAYWLKVIDVTNNLDTLLVKSAFFIINNKDKSEGINILNAEEALQILVSKGIVQSPDFWTRAIGVIKFLDALLINLAKVISKK